MANSNHLLPPKNVAEAIALFEKSRLSDSVDEIFNCLVRLNPINLEDEILISLVWFIERMAKRFDISVPHVNIFGTGGDKTLNISTITGIVASYDICVMKVGTKAVTSHWGSSEFIAELEIQNKQLFFEKQQLLPNFKSPSRFLPLSELGFNYGDELRIARRMLKETSIPDIYKMVFPSTNLTGYMGRVTGYFNKDYKRQLICIAKQLDHNALLVHSEHGIDELMPGKNALTHIIKGKVTEFEIDLPGEEQAIFDFFSEKDYLQDHIKMYKELISDENHFAWIVIAYNIASCLFVRNMGIGSFDSYLNLANQLIKKICRNYAN